MSIEDFNKVMDAYNLEYTEATSEKEQEAITLKYETLISKAETVLESAMEAQVQAENAKIKAEEEAFNVLVEKWANETFEEVKDSLNDLLENEKRRFSLIESKRERLNKINERAGDSENTNELLDISFKAVDDFSQWFSDYYDLRKKAIKKYRAITRKDNIQFEKDIPEELRHGIFSHVGKTFETYLRYSSDTSPTSFDLKSTIGLGLKIFNMPGEKVISDDGANVADLILQNSSNFFVDDVIIEDNIAQDAMPSVCAPVATDMACNAAPIGFDNGITSSWSVVDNAGTGIVWSTIAGSGIGGNYTGGTGDAASVSSDSTPGEFDTELHSNSFSLVGWTGASLEYMVDYQNYGSLDFLNLDISIDGGSSWVNMLSWNEDHPVGGLFTSDGEAVSVDLSHYAGEADVKLRWHYFDPNAGDWDWYAQVDDVALVCNNVPQALKCDVNLDGFVDRSDINLIGAARNQPASPGDPRDNDEDGIITMSDARQCTQVCTLPRCASQAP